MSIDEGRRRVDEPTPGEIMRRLDEVARQLVDVARRIDEQNKHAAQTYVRQDVYMAQRQADQAVTAEVAGDVRANAESIKAVHVRLDLSEDKRRAATRVNVANAIALTGVIIAVIAMVLNRGAL